jgi:hypothetical protein
MKYRNNLAENTALFTLDTLWVGLLGRVMSPSQGLYLHRTAQHRQTRTNIHALSGIRTHNPSVREIKAHAPDRAATVTDEDAVPTSKKTQRVSITKIN